MKPPADGHPVDVAIVGAGPAGAWAAYLLARRGARVRLFNPSHPREKPCGGGVTGRACSLVREAVAVDQLPGVSITAARFIGEPARLSATVALEGNGSGNALMVASRRELDRRLLDAACRAGADHIATRVVDVACDPRGAQLRTSDGLLHRADWIIGADGPNSLIRRRLTRPFRRDQLSIATGFFAHGTTSDEIVIEIVHDPPGYIWSFPRPDHLAIGICAPADAGVSVAALREATARWIRSTGVGAAADLEPYSWPIPSLSVADINALAIAGPRWLLVGDAAGFADPITREGIYFALQSAEDAAAALTASVDPSRDYLRRVRVGIAGELRRAARLKAGFFRPRFTRLLVGALARSEGIRRVMADLVAGTQGYRGLEWRLAQTMEVRLAWEFVQLARTQRRHPDARVLR